MKRVFKVLGLLALLAAGIGTNAALAAAPAGKGVGSGCTVETPPKDAAYKESHGLGVYLWPAHRPKRYGGCQKIWLNDEEKTEIAVAFYEDGKAVLLLERPMIDEDVWRICRYANGARLKSAQQGCPDSFDGF